MSKKSNATPGVYIEEKDAFGRSIVPVSTAIPCFIGYTEKAMRGEKSVTKALVKISSFNDFQSIFGAGFKQQYTVNLDSETGAIKVPSPKRPYYTYPSLKAFYANGGETCYIYSIGDYGTPLQANDFIEALEALKKEPEPTIILAPDALTLSAADYYSLWSLILVHCKEMINRFAIIDVHGGQAISNQTDANKRDALIHNHRANLSGALSYGASYWPWLQATVVQPTELSFDNIENWDTAIKSAIQKEVVEKMNEADFNTHFPVLPTDVVEKAKAIEKQHKTFLQISPLYKSIMKTLRDTANILPPSGPMAGVYTSVDTQIGTFQSPANVGLGAIVKPLLSIDDHSQEDLNIPLDGKAINAIRTFPGKGVLIWGARTLDGNSQDWRYISVRRTVSMIELSIKYAAEAYVFEPNNASTWTNIQAMISNFLTNMWYQGALAGSSPAESFSVSVGLGSTMTSVDILDGKMRIMVKIAVTRPAEFIVITFEQQMQTA